MCFTAKKDKEKLLQQFRLKKDVSDDKNFWKTVKPFLSDKIVSKESILSVENDEIISEDSKIVKSLNTCFSNIVKNLKIHGYRPHNDSLFENVSDLT